MIFQRIPAQLRQAVSLLHTGLVAIGLVAIGFAAFLALAVPLGTHVRDYWKDVFQAWSGPTQAGQPFNQQSGPAGKKAAKL